MNWNELARQLARGIIAAQAMDDVQRALVRLTLVDVVAALPPIFHGPQPCPGYATGGLMEGRYVPGGYVRSGPEFVIPVRGVDDPPPGFPNYGADPKGRDEDELCRDFPSPRRPWLVPAVKRLLAGRAEGSKGHFPDGGVGLGS